MAPDIDEDFLETVRQHPIIYINRTKSNAGNKNIRKRDKIWSKIGAKHNMSMDEAKSKWRNIRDNYKKFQNKKKLGTPLGSSKYEDQRYSFINGDLPEDVELNESTEDEEYVPEYNRKKEKVMKIDDSTIDNNILLETEEILADADPLYNDETGDTSSVANQSNYNRDQDESVQNFFKSMADIVCKFPPRQRAEIRLGVCNLVTDMELRLLQNGDFYKTYFK